MPSVFDGLLPEPVSLARASGCFTSSTRPTLKTVGLLEDEVAALFRLARSTPWSFQCSAAADAQFLVSVDGDLNPEAYQLSIQPAAVSIRAGSYAGVAYALQTLRQLLPAGLARSSSSTERIELPCCEIVDAPAYAWRGGMLDVARHFLTKLELLKHIEQLGSMKLNRIHLHLSDDQGWRVESLRHPRLHEIGAYRARTATNHFFAPPTFDDVPHGGYYTQDDLREIVAFAADRGMVVVPEIDLPGHSTAMLAAYPQFGTPPEPRIVGEGWGIKSGLVAYTAEALAFLTDVLEELLSVAHFPYLHIGGDEANPLPWLDDARVVSYGALHDASTPAQMFQSFMHELATFVRQCGSQLMAWDDSFAAQLDAGGADSETVFTVWRGMRMAQKVADHGFDVVLAPVFPTYFDYSQSDDPREPLAIGGPVRLQDVIEWSPTDDWTAAQKARVLGVQFQVWSEFIRTPRHRDYMMYPRACALAQVAWAGTGMPVHDFAPQLEAALRRLRAAGIEPRDSAGPTPAQASPDGVVIPSLPAPIQVLLGMLEQAALDGRMMEFEPPAQ